MLQIRRTLESTILKGKANTKVVYENIWLRFICKMESETDLSLVERFISFYFQSDD